MGGLLLVATMGGVASGHTGNSGSSLAPDSEDPAIQAAAADYYVTQYGVSEDVAKQRLQIQDDAQAVLDGVVKDVGSNWAGSWFDPSDGGRFKIAVAGSGNPPSGTAIDAARTLLATKGVDGYTDFVAVTSTWAQLTSAQTTINTDLADLVAAGKVVTSIQPARNSVVISTADDLTADQMTEVNSVRSTASTMVQPTNVSDLRPENQSCKLATDGSYSPSELFCDPPLRGGIFMSSENHWGCTAGFYVTSVTDEKDYLLTAGHCVSDSAGTMWQTRFADESSHDIGVGHNYVCACQAPYTSNGDYGIISIDNPAGWGLTSSSTVVWVGPSANGQTTQNSLYPIYQDDTSSQGLVVCMTSGVLITQTGYHTDCGEVQALNASDGGVSGLAKTNLCGQGGDSGSPVYKNDTGYGIIVSGKSDTCLEYYQGLQAAEQGMNVTIVP